MGDVVAVPLRVMVTEEDDEEDGSMSFVTMDLDWDVVPRCCMDEGIRGGLRGY